MNRQREPESEFERRLRAELGAIVAARGAAEEARGTGAGASAGPAWRRRGPRLALAGAAVVAIAVGALIVRAGGGDTPAAFAVEARPEGEVSVEIRRLGDARGLEAALDEAGIPTSVTYLPAGLTCKEPRFRRAPWPARARALIAGPGGAEYRAMLRDPQDGDGPFIFQIGRDAVGPGQTLVITASPSPEALLGGASLDIAEGAVAPCEPVPVGG